MAKDRKIKLLYVCSSEVQLICYIRAIDSTETYLRPLPAIKVFNYAGFSLTLGEYYQLY